MIDNNMAKVDWVLNRMMKSAHILVAGTTGAGKSVLLNAMLYSALKENCPYGGYGEGLAELYLIDTKRVGLTMWRNWPRCHRCTDPKSVASELDFIIENMEGTLWRMERDGLEETTEPDVYIVVDELAHVVGEKGVLERLVTIGRLGRAAHYHLVCGTQDPSRTTLSAQLMQNFTCRIALRTKDATESIQIIGNDSAKYITEYGFAYADCDGRYGSFNFDKVSREDIDNLVSSTRKAFEWEQYMTSKPTLWERITRRHQRCANYYWEECVDPEYVEMLRLGKATL